MNNKNGDRCCRGCGETVTSLSYWVCYGYHADCVPEERKERDGKTARETRKKTKRTTNTSSRSKKSVGINLWI